MQDAADILIVGAGPTGLTLALELARHGVSLRIVDKELERHPTSRALVIQPRTQELLSRHDGFREQLLAKASVMRGVRWHLSKTRQTYADFTDIGLLDTEFPAIANVSQVETESFLESCLEKMTTPDGRRYMVERGLEATAIVQDPEGVTVTLSTATRADADTGGSSGTKPEQQTVRCKYIVGCDGARSAVRGAAPSIEYRGGTYQHDFILCDATITVNSLLKGDFEIGLAGRFVIAMPLGRDDDRIRIACARDRGSGFERHVTPSLDEFQTLLDETYESPGTLSNPTWLTAYRLHWRCASRYREGRLFLAGDAAHIHSPLGGQGMNTGIQDAVNLGWKLAAATSSGGGDAASTEALLDTYDEERRPVGERLIKTTDRMFRFVTVRNPVVVWLRKLLLPWLRKVGLSTPRCRRLFLLFITEFGVNYRRSRIVGTAQGFGGPVRGGDRLPDGKLVELPVAGLVGIGDNDRSGDANSRRDSGIALPRETTLQRLCGGTAHNLLLFSAVGAGAVSVRELVIAATEVAAVRNDVVAVVILAGSSESSDDDLGAEPQDGPKNMYRDSEGSLHARYGFCKKPGYVLSRPDGYATHVGYLSSLGDLLAFLKT